MPKQPEPFKVFYDARQTAKSNASFSPSAGKPGQVVESWKALKVPLTIESFTPATRAQISQVHSPEYVNGVLDLETPNGFGNTSADVAESLPWVCGSAIAAALAAFGSKRPTFSPTSGAHHAHWSSGGGFCTFNSLVLAAQEVHKAGVQRVGIIDLDQHFGDGTENIKNRLNLDFLEQYSFGGEDVRAGKSAARWLKSLEKKVNAFADYDLVLFNAGADPHVNDPLGGVLTSQQMADRDRIVYKVLNAMKVPVVTMLAGGYQKDSQGSIRPVLDIHDQTMLACHAVYNLGGRS